MILYLVVSMVLFTNSCKMDRFLNKNGSKVKNSMKKNFRKILEIHLRLTSLLSDLKKIKKSKI